MIESQSGAARARRAATFRAVLCAGILSLAGAAYAQPTSSGSNTGAITFTGGFDLPSVYVFRGIVQETNPRLTMWPYGDIGIALKSGDGAVKRVAVDVGVWNSLMTGSSGSDGFTRHLHYEENFNSTLSLVFARHITAGATYTAYTSPNLMFDTVKEVSVKVAQASRINPYGLIGFEVGDHGADGGAKKGTYVELGAGPTFSLGSRALFTVPAKVGLSAHNYYEHPLTGVDNKFGFFDVGGLLTLPLHGVPARFGAWNVHGGVDLIVFGDTTKYFNQDDKSKVVGLVGIGVTY